VRFIEIKINIRKKEYGETLKRYLMSEKKLIKNVTLLRNRHIEKKFCNSYECVNELPISPCRREYCSKYCQNRIQNIRFALEICDWRNFFRQKKCKLNETKVEKRKYYFENLKNKIGSDVLIFDYAPLPITDMNVENCEKNKRTDLRVFLILFFLTFLLEK
jgi:hypothetical protein